MKSKRVNSLIFWDLDGTLMHCGYDGTKALNDTFQKLYGLEDACLKARVGHSMDSVTLNRIFERYQLDKNELEKVKEEYIHILRRILIQDQNKKILPGIKEILEYTNSSDNIFNALLTNNLRRGAETKLESVGLNHYFSVGGFGDDVLGEKWDAAVIGVRAAESYYSIKFEKENINIIGDSVYDIECAKKINAVSISVATGFTARDTLIAEKPDYFYDDLSAWKSIIQKHNW
ncbi:MAG: HAD family hydrolase [Eubacteriales bacterium]|nr:HAD family hydrolase [Eubacteriales bacterium]